MSQLDQYGRLRGVSREPGELDASFRQRLLATFTNSIYPIRATITIRFANPEDHPEPAAPRAAWMDDAAPAPIPDRTYHPENAEPLEDLEWLKGLSAALAKPLRARIGERVVGECDCATCQEPPE